MMLRKSQYRAEYYENKHTKEAPVQEYIDELNENHQKKIFSFVNKLVEESGRLGWPHAEHIKDKIWQLRPGPHRLFYFIFTGERIILLHIFRKKSQKTPRREIDRALNNYIDFINNH